MMIIFFRILFIIIIINISIKKSKILKFFQCHCYIVLNMLISVIANIRFVSFLLIQGLFIVWFSFR